MTAGARRHTAGHTAGHTEDRRRASGARPMGIKEKRREGKRQGSQGAHTEDRTGQATGTHGSHGTHNRQEQTGTEGAGRKKDMIYLRERGGEKHRRDSQKRASVCIYISLNIVAWWLFIALSFIYYKGVYCIYLYI